MEKKSSNGLKVLSLENRWRECWYWFDTFLLPNHVETCFCANSLPDVYEAMGLSWTHHWSTEIWGKDGMTHTWCLRCLWPDTCRDAWDVNHLKKRWLLHVSPGCVLAVWLIPTGQKCPTLFAIKLYLGNWSGCQIHLDSNSQRHKQVSVRDRL